MTEKQPTIPRSAQEWLGCVPPNQPFAGRAWAELQEIIDDLQTVLLDSVATRRLARTFPRLANDLTEYRAYHPSCALLDDVLAVPDDWVLRVLDTTTFTGHRVMIEGIANCHELHVALARLLRRAVPDPTSRVITADFQLVRADRYLLMGQPQGFASVNSWLWGHESPAQLPIWNGEPTVLMIEPAFARQWIAQSRFPAMPAKVEILEVLSETDVRTWLGRSVAAATLGTRRQAA